jgi:hypothetical protein
MGKTKLYVRDDAMRLDRLAAVCVFVSPVQTTVLASYLAIEWLEI